jgi:outer membrane protein TolC
MTIPSRAFRIFAPTLALAASVWADPAALSVDDAFTRAVEHNSDIALARLGIEEASGQFKTARSGLLPKVDGGVSSTEQQRSLEAFGFSKGIEFTGQTIGPNGRAADIALTAVPDDTIGPYTVSEALGRLTMAILDLQTLHAVRASRANMTLQELNVAAVTESVLARVAALYNRALFDAQAVDAMRQGVTLREERLRLTRDAQAAGSVTELDVQRESLKLSIARRELISGENRNEATQRELRRLLDLDPAAPLTLTGSLQFQPIRMNKQDHALEMALARRPDYLAQQQAERVARHLVASARAGRWPRLTLSGDYGMQGEDYSDTVETWSIGAGLDIPIWDSFKTDGEIETAESRKGQEETRTSALAASIGAEIETASDELDLREQAVAVAREAVAVAESALVCVRDGAAAGESTPLDVLQAQVDLADARVEEVQAVQDYNAACIEWFRAVGDVQLYALVVSRL